MIFQLSYTNMLKFNQYFCFIFNIKSSFDIQSLLKKKSTKKLHIIK
jgi:hypothetical protein